MEDKICPKCKQKMLYVHTVVTNDNNIKYELCCYLCNYVSKEYETITEAMNNYETEIF